MTLDELRSSAMMVAEPLAILAEGRGVSPNQLSGLSLLFAIAASALYYFSIHRMALLYAAALMVLLSAMLDAIDGVLARKTGAADPRGDFLDHIVDRYADMFMLVGIILAGYTPWPIGLLAVIGVLLTSYIGIQAQALNLGRYYGGIMGRADRMTAIFLATLGNAIYPDFIAGLPILGWTLLAIMLSSHITAAQRIIHIWKKLQPTRELCPFPSGGGGDHRKINL